MTQAIETIKILVVSAVESDLAGVKAVLAQTGASVLCARSGSEALEILRVEDVALALLDVHMAPMGGFELAERMRGADRTRDIPIILMTVASHDLVQIFRGYERAPVDFLHKPLNPHILKSKVGVFIELYSQRRGLQARTLELQRTLRLNDAFATVLGHDLRNPLNAISMGAELLLRMSTDEKVASVAGRIRSSTQRMAKMIAQLLDVARIRGKGVSLAMQVGDLSDACVAVRDELEVGQAAGRLAVSRHGDTSATFDIDRLSQVFSTLMGNALQHSVPDTRVEVTLDGTHPGVVSVEIRNQGVIPLERQRTLFEPLESSGTTHRGLGLYIASQFVRAHGGDLEMRSNESERTVFSFSIPRAPKPSAQAPA